MADKNEFQRFASPNELRNVVREDLGIFYAVIVAAIYDVENGVDVSTPASFFAPLRRCIEKHPQLCVTVGDMHALKPFYQRVPVINLKDHIFILDTTGDDGYSGIEKFLATDLDQPFKSGIPPWRISVIPYRGRCFVSFAYSHTIGDGTSGAAFHRTFLEGWRSLPPSESAEPEVVETPARPFPPPFDTAQRLPISLSFMLAPILSLILPTSIYNWLDLRSPASPGDKGTFQGSLVFMPEPDRSATQLSLQEIDANTLQNAINVARKHDAKLTGVLHQVIVRALSRAVQDSNITNFVSQTPLNLRRAIGASDDEMGNFVSASYLRHPKTEPSEEFSEEEWARAREDTRRLAQDAATLQDQPIGLLRLLPNIRSWILGKVGKGRECSYELSNIGSFDSGDSQAIGQGTRAKVTKVVFTQPGHVIGQSLAFSFAAVKGGSLMYTVTWKLGSTGLTDDEERKFVEGICASIRKDLEHLM
ncbi:uncharacterized protein E0L32_009871 [Thyridium curvatum]|uniref:Alcohol acetyltransferase n=1 Tax=Thyridium curvatum TaxID=1093900 RepID=A0A507AHV0_9PEZI|nr:uncharacterized protein E0L32_009871 [Thyridium curvatum]TPX08682.1 hypothetical protein E0L32_009871 [Thyridium curvatum]